MSRWVIHIHRIAPDIHIPIIIEQIRRVRHQGIRADKLAQFGVIGSAGSPTVAGTVVHQAGAIAFLAGEAVLGAEFVVGALATVGVFALVVVESD